MRTALPVYTVDITGAPTQTGKTIGFTIGFLVKAALHIGLTRIVSSVPMEWPKTGRNGYATSILQTDTSYCYLCGRRDRKLDRHEPFGGAYRGKSKALGLWVVLCHDDCHEGRNGAHGDPAVNEALRREAQEAAMKTYGWTTADFIREFGKNHL